MLVKAYAQHAVDDRHYPDSLTRLLQSASSDSTRANTFFLLSDYWSDKDRLKALGYARQGLQSSKGNGFYTGLAHFYLGGVYFEYDDRQSQHEYMLAEKLLSLYDTRQAFQYRSRLWHNYGVIEQRKDNNKAFADILLNKAIPFAIKANDSIRIADNYATVGIIFMNLNEYKKAISHYKRALNLLHHSTKLYAEFADWYTNIAQAYIFDGEYPTAKPYLDSAFKILSNNTESSYLPAYYCAEGMYYTRSGSYVNALNSLNKGIKLAEKLNRPYDVTSLLYQKYKTYQAQKNYQAAKPILFQLYQNEKSSPLAANRQMILYEMAQTDAILGHTKLAYQWLMQYSKLSDSLFSAKTQTEVASLEAKYQNAEKEKEILKLQNERNTTLQQQRYNKLFYFSIIILLCLLCLLAFIQLRNRKRIALKNEIQYRNELERIQQEKQLSTYAAIMQGQEQERQRLARDLHDGLGGLLAGVKMDVSKITDKSEMKSGVYAQLKVVTDQLDGSVNELRRIARNLMPETLFKFGLIAALKDFCEGLENEQTRIVFQCYGINEQNINETSQMMIYRIVQELVTNALKHAQAKNILVDCMLNDNQVNITVEDNGIGFDPETISGNGIGLTNIRARVNFLNGKLSIQSVHNIGTTVNIEFIENDKTATDIPVNS